MIDKGIDDLDYIDDDYDDEDDIEICSITGEKCFGNPFFCEECSVITGEDEDES